MIELKSITVDASDLLTDGYPMFAASKTVTISSSSLFTGEIGVSIWSPQKHPTSCPNCGAPVTNQKCEYCGTLLWR